MNILCLGGGPAGLYFGLLMKRANPAHQVTVVERNRADDTFGWGVVLSDQTLANLRAADPESAQHIGAAFHHWDDIEVFFKGQRMRSGGHGFCGIGRKTLLQILQQRCRELGVVLRFETEARDEQALAREYQADLVIAADGLNSRIRERYAQTYQPDIDLRQCRFVWLGTHKKFDAFTFAFEQTEHGWFQAHAYQFNADTSTFIVETPESVWQAHGLDQQTQEQGIDFCQKLFAPYLSGERLMSNAAHLRGSAIWLRFPRVMCQRWVHWAELDGRSVPIVLMGDAAHTAHFSIGSGSKLALEDAIDLSQALSQALSQTLGQAPGQGQGQAPQALAAALSAYQERRHVEVLKLQNAARNSTEWFENVARYSGFEIEQLYYALLTRSQRISHENLRQRDPAWLLGYERWLSANAATAPAPVPKPAPSPAPDTQPAAKATAPLPMMLPLSLRNLRLSNRIVVSPMATYSAREGVVQDFHLVHLGARALGGAGLVMVEMTSPTAQGRITEGCPGLWNDEQQTAFTRVVDFVHQHSPAKIGLQLGHSGPKGSTQVGWEQTDEPLPNAGNDPAASPNWPLLAASALAYGAQNQVPQAMTEADRQALLQAFVQSTERAAAAGFDWLELHCAHGYLLSSFICPLTNQRQDEYGGSLENRCRFPLQVFRAMRAVWPVHLPMSVRISAHDWAPGGNTPDDAVAIARLFKAAGCDVIDVSSGQTTRAAKPVYGRMYQTPFADRIRNEVDIYTIAVGAITEADQANSIIAAGRADLCAIARPHLADAAWTQHEVAKLGRHEVAWPKQYLSGRDQLYRELEKQRALAAATSAAQAPNEAQEQWV